MENEKTTVQTSEAAQPAAETAAQPAAETAAQPAAETAAQPAAEAAAQPAAEAAAQPVKKKKLIRHMIWLVSLVSLFVVIGGGLAGSIPFAVLQYVQNITDSGTLFLFQYASTIGCVIFLLIYLVIFERPILRSFGYKAKNGGQGNTFGIFGLGLLAGFVMNGACILAAWLNGDIFFYADGFDVVYMLVGFLFVCIQSGSEEILTRGYMMRAIDERYNIWVAAIYNSLFFGILHIFNPGITVVAMLSIILIGFGLSLAAIYFKSIGFCIALHTAWNFCQSLFFGLPNSGIVSEKSFLHLEASNARDSFFYNVNFGVESTWFAVIVELVFIAVLAALIIRKSKKGEKVMALRTFDTAD